MDEQAFVEMLRVELNRSVAMLKKARLGQVNPGMAVSYVKSNLAFLPGFIQEIEAKGLKPGGELFVPSRRKSTKNTTPPVASGNTPHTQGKKSA